MNNLIVMLSLFAASAVAQAPAPDQKNPMSTWLRNAYTGNRNNIVRTAEKMPEENYAMRPGAQQDRAYFRSAGDPRVAFFNFNFGARRPRARRIPTRAALTS